MARDPHLQRFAGSTDPGLEDGQSGSDHPMRAGSILVPWQHLKLVLHFVCELRESSFPSGHSSDSSWTPPCAGVTKVSGLDPAISCSKTSQMTGDSRHAQP